MLRTFFTNFDMFGAFPTFRMRGESETYNICGGIASLVILLFFLYIFIINALDIVNYNNIEARIINEVAERGENEFEMDLVFALNLKYYSLELALEMFEFKVNHMTQRSQIVEQQPLELEKCQVSHFQSLGDNAQLYYERYLMDQKLCLKPGQNLKLKGIFNAYAPQTKYIKITVYQCSVNTSSTCLPEPQRTTLIDFFLGNLLYLIIDFSIINIAFNPENKDPIVKYIQNRNWITFTRTSGTEMLLEVGTYEIESDVSMTPVIQKESLTGSYIYKMISSTFIRTSDDNYFVAIVFQIGSQHLYIQREYGKLDDTLSYVGGLFGLIISFLAFFMMSFNEYRYELFVAEAFSFKNQNKTKESDFHFFMYLKYSLYDWIKTFTCCEPSWQDCKKIDSAREEGVEQVDVQFLLKRISHLQQMNHSLVSRDEDFINYLTERQHFEDIKKRRTIISYYDKMTQGSYPLTIENLHTIESVLSLGSSLNLKKGNLSETELNLHFGKEKSEIEEALEKAGSLIEVDEEQIGLNEEEKVAEEQMAEVFFNLPFEKRQKLQLKIPLKILKRFQEKRKNAIFVKNREYDFND